MFQNYITLNKLLVLFENMYQVNIYDCESDEYNVNLVLWLQICSSCHA